MSTPGRAEHRARSSATSRNFSRCADRAQQGFVNFMYLGRLLIHPPGSATIPRSVHKDGGRSGDRHARASSTTATARAASWAARSTALAPDFNRAVLGVPGDELLDAAPPQRRLRPVRAELGACYRRHYPNELERPLILSLMQMLWDRGEANGYAHHMTDDPLPGHAGAHGPAARGVRRPPGRERHDRGRGAHDRRVDPQAGARPRPAHAT